MLKKQKIQEKSVLMAGGRRMKKRRKASDGREQFQLPSIHLSRETKQGVLVVFLFAVSFLGFLSLLGLAGVVGQWIEQWLGIAFGWTRFILPFMLLVLGYLYLYPEKYRVKWVHLLGLFLFLLSFQGLLHLAIDMPESLTAAQAKQGGGYFGFAASYPLQTYTGFPATLVILLAVFLASFLLTFETSLSRFRDHARALARFFRWVRMRWTAYRYSGPSVVTRDEGMIGFEEREIPESQNHRITKSPNQKSSDGPQTVVEEDGQMAMEVRKRRVPRKLDLPFNLLEPTSGKPMSGDIVANTEIIQRTLKNFNIEVEMGDVSVGPTVTQYTLKPSEGVRLSEITALNNDLALALAAHPIRIEAPIPGKALVGMEVPNQKVAIVMLREMLESSSFKKRKSNMMIALGKDVSGEPWFADLPSMPHLLVAGSTGSGKSVCLNAVIVSLLYQNGPDDLKFILVDPKRVELPVYNSIPHLLTPVITDVKKTVNALKWLISEMDRRFDILAKERKRDITAYNRDNPESRMPYIVLIIDELADLMVAAASEVEGAIIRLAQMARAVGIHLIVATQRPSVDVLTGLIKANITSRIAFAVASQMDSRTILDTGGAEKLLGRGDLLFISPELSKPKRLQGGYVSEKEIHRIVAYCVAHGAAEYDPNVVEKPFRKDVGTSVNSTAEDEEKDSLMPDAKEVILQAGKASASLLQRRLKVGYARAARLLDLLEEEGFIGPGEGAKPREVLFVRGENGTLEDVDSIADDTEKADNADSETDDAEEADDAESEEEDGDENVEEEGEAVDGESEEEEKQ